MSGRLSLSYTAAGIRRADTVALARAFADCGDWGVVRRRSIQDDLLMIRQESSCKRVTSELLKRLRTLLPAELAALADPPSADFANAVCWLAICRTYAFVRGFVTGVVGLRWQEGVRTLSAGAYEAYVDDEAELHPELVALSEQTKARLRSQLFTMLREMGFLDRADELHPYLLPEGIGPLIDPEDVFPTLVS